MLVAQKQSGMRAMNLIEKCPRLVVKGLHPFSRFSKGGIDVNVSQSIRLQLKADVHQYEAQYFEVVYGSFKPILYFYGELLKVTSHGVFLAVNIICF